MARSAKHPDPRKPNYVDVVVGRNVRLWRLVRGLSQSDLARRSDVTFQQVQKYEAGTNRISWGRLTKFSRILAVPLSALLHGFQNEGTLASLKLFDRAGAYRLATAFAGIPNRNIRERLAEIVEQISAAVPHAKRKKRGSRRKGGKARAR